MLAYAPGKGTKIMGCRPVTRVAAIVLGAGLLAACAEQPEDAIGSAEQSLRLASMSPAPAETDRLIAETKRKLAGANLPTADRGVASMLRAQAEIIEVGIEMGDFNASIADVDIRLGRVGSLARQTLMLAQQKRSADVRMANVNARGSSLDAERAAAVDAKQAAEIEATRLREELEAVRSQRTALEAAERERLLEAARLEQQARDRNVLTSETSIRIRDLRNEAAALRTQADTAFAREEQLSGDESIQRSGMLNQQLARIALEEAKIAAIDQSVRNLRDLEALVTAESRDLADQFEQAVTRLRGAMLGESGLTAMLEALDQQAKDVQETSLISGASVNQSRQVPAFRAMVELVSSGAEMTAAQPRLEAGLRDLRLARMLRETLAVGGENGAIASASPALAEALRSAGNQATARAVAHFGAAQENFEQASMTLGEVVEGQSPQSLNEYLAQTASQLASDAARLMAHAQNPQANPMPDTNQLKRRIEERRRLGNQLTAVWQVEATR